MKVNAQKRTHAARIASCVGLIVVFCWVLLGEFPLEANATGKDGKDSDRGTMQIPAGTILPVRLNQTISSEKSKTGQMITGRIMQDVPLANGQKIGEGSTVEGSIVDVAPASGGSAARMTLQFKSVRAGRQVIPITVNLRAIGSPLEVSSARVPPSGPDYGTPYVWWNTTQIGGDQVYGQLDGDVYSDDVLVGKSVYDGVLVHVRASEDGGCRGPIAGDDQPQALWVFSSDACGVYGLPNLQIEHAGRTDPVGKIALESNSREVLVRSGSGLLLRVD
jgi:hypothetical protein